MNQFILNIMIIYSIASLIYILYLIVIKPKKISDIINKDIKDKYESIKKNRIMVFIIGIVIGLAFIIMIQKEPIDSTISASCISSATKSLVEDVSDISVI